MNTEDKVKKITDITSMVIALVIAITMPVGYFFTSFNYEKKSLQDQANLSADQLSEYIYTQPDTWVYQDHRLEDILSINTWHKKSVYYRVIDIEKNTIMVIDSELKSPDISATAKLTDGISDVGLVETRSSIRPLLINTFVVILFSLFIAFSVRYVLRVLPFAALERLLKDLKLSHEQLETEVLAKEQAFKEQRKLSEAMHHQVTHDVLTGLPNRSYFNFHLNETITQSFRDGKIFAVMLIDLNRFREINDALGYEKGDKALCEVSERISKVLAEKSILARLGGDEFAVLTADTSSSGTIDQVELINDVFKTRILIADYHLTVSASIGLAYYPKHGQKSEELMSHADIAMQHAKQRAQSYSIYDFSFDSNNPNQLVLTAELRHAIDNGGLSLHYQPKVDLKTGKIVAVEALARWNHPHLGMIAPDVFIPIAEQSGMINALTEWVITTAVKQLSSWKRSGLELNVAINISAHNLHDNNFSQQIKSLLILHKLDPHYLMIEITEGSIMIDPPRSKALIEDLAQWGIHFSVDDYGTGYSSLAYLKKLTVHELKIDRAFVMNMLSDNSDQIIVKSTIELAHNLDLVVVAEGVEDQATYDMLKTYGCDLVQGYHICKPIAADALQNWLMELSHKDQYQIN